MRERRGELLEKQLAVDAFFAFFRQNRDMLMAWPGRVSAMMAGELQVGHREMTVLLDRYVREFLEEAANARPPAIISGGREIHLPQEEGEGHDETS